MYESYYYGVRGPGFLVSQSGSYSNQGPYKSLNPYNPKPLIDAFKGTPYWIPLMERLIVVARKLEHHYPHALKVSYTES